MLHSQNINMCTHPEGIDTWLVGHVHVPTFITLLYIYMLTTIILALPINKVISLKMSILY